MPDLIIKPKNQSGNKLILQDQSGSAVLTTADSGATYANATLTTPTIANMANCTFPAGHIIQTGYVEDGVRRTTATRYSSGNWEEITGAFKVEITPSSATNYILCQGSCNAGQSESTYGIAFRWYVTGGGTDGYVGDGTNANGSQKVANSGGPTSSGTHANFRYCPQVRFRLNDSTPNWTSGVLTIKLHWAVGGAGTGYWNESGNAGSDSNYVNSLSSFVVHEIQG